MEKEGSCSFDWNKPVSIQSSDFLYHTRYQVDFFITSSLISHYTYPHILKAFLMIPECPLLPRYNPEIIETLESYVAYQAEEEVYDFEANLALLKLYQFRPACINRDAAAQVLLKALTQMPTTDFVTLKCVLALNLVSLV